MIFVDTSAWYARYTPRDPNHRTAVSLHRSTSEPLLTTDYVIDETLTLLKVRGNFNRALEIGPVLLSGSLAQLIWVAPGDVESAWQIFDRYRDKAWSFTDCVSYAVIRRLGITQAFAFDDHFRQFGIVQVVP
jgi:predicted nucleic acid-binding protein